MRLFLVFVVAVLVGSGTILYAKIYLVHRTQRLFVYWCYGLMYQSIIIGTFYQFPEIWYTRAGFLLALYGLFRFCEGLKLPAGWSQAPGPALSPQTGLPKVGAPQGKEKSNPPPPPLAGAPNFVYSNQKGTLWEI